MQIKVLGPGCPRCKQLAEHVEAAIEELGIDCHVDKVTDMDAIIDHGVMMTPALVVDGRVKMTGKVPSIQDLKAILQEAGA